MKKFYRCLSVLMLGILTQAMSCDEELPEYTYILVNHVPQYPYLTTVSSAFFQANVAGYGWKWKESWRINENGVGERYHPDRQSDYVPNDLYFGADSMTVFVYKQSSNERRTDSYTYDAADNRILSPTIVYMQLTHADSLTISFIEQLGSDYYESSYVRMLPYELNARWNGSKPVDP